LDHVGVLAKNARDAALLLSVIAGADSRDPASVDLSVPEYSQGLAANIRGIRLGFLRGFFANDVRDDVKGCVETAVGRLCDLRAHAEEVSLPLMNHVPGASLTIMTAESYAVHERFLRERAHEYGADVRLRLLMGAMVSASQYLRAQRFRRPLYEQTAEAMERLDVLVAPTTPIPATSIGQELVRIGNKEIAVGTCLTRLTRPANVTGCPPFPCRADFRPRVCRWVFR
jgi:aspartyl-tRNA(Asn)/glutamyl-tRNA(Gln) amidotransferase subunit A